MALPLDEFVAGGLLGALPPELRRALEQTAIQLPPIPAGTVIHAPSEGPRLGLIARGLMRVLIASPGGKEATIFYAVRGELLGVPTLFGPAPPVSVQAMIESQMIGLDPDLLIKGMASTPGVALAVARDLAFRLDNAVRHIAQHAFAPVPMRLAWHLLELGSKSASEGDRGLRVSQQALADAVGSAREVIARILGRWTKDAVVTVARGEILIRDPLFLARVASQDSPDATALE